MVQATGAPGETAPAQGLRWLLDRCATTGTPQDGDERRDQRTMTLTGFRPNARPSTRRATETPESERGRVSTKSVRERARLAQPKRQLRKRCWTIQYRQHQEEKSLPGKMFEPIATPAHRQPITAARPRCDEPVPTPPFGQLLRSYPVGKQGARKPNHPVFGEVVHRPLVPCPQRRGSECRRQRHAREHPRHSETTPEPEQDRVSRTTRPLREVTIETGCRQVVLPVSDSSASSPRLPPPLSVGKAACPSPHRPDTQPPP